MTNPIVEKFCAACQQIKLAQEYYPTRVHPDGLSTYCKECVKRGRKASYDQRRHSRFWRSVEKAEGRCWMWKGAPDGSGYGTIKYRGVSIGAHRFSWELAYGPVPDGLCVLHRCDTPLCVNPEHLFLGTKQHNSDDKLQKGRQAKGERVGSARFTEVTVRLIRARADEGLGYKKLRKEFNGSLSAIRSIVKRITWKHVV